MVLQLLNGPLLKVDNVGRRDTTPKPELHNKMQMGYLGMQRDNGRFHLFVSRSVALHTSYGGLHHGANCIRITDALAVPTPVGLWKPENARRLAWVST